jgi:1-deoxy-D-xylulose-5-phosphate synthase
VGTAEVLSASSTDPDVSIIACGAMSGAALEAAQALNTNGITTEVIDPVQPLPVSQQLVSHLVGRAFVVTIEDGLVDGGVGQALLGELHAKSPNTRTLALGIPKTFLRHASRATLLNECGLDAAGIANSITRTLQSEVSQ